MANDRNGFGAAFVVVWLISALLSLAVTGVIIWGIIELVQWLTSK